MPSVRIYPRLWKLALLMFSGIYAISSIYTIHMSMLIDKQLERSEAAGVSKIFAPEKAVVKGFVTEAADVVESFVKELDLQKEQVFEPKGDDSKESITLSVEKVRQEEEVALRSEVRPEEAVETKADVEEVQAKSDMEHVPIGRVEIERMDICSNPWSWVVFMGDSNMRHTFYWWVGQLKGDRRASQTFGLDRTDLGFGGRWADQEVVVKTVEEKQQFRRVSFRFLHGTMEEFMHSSTHWDTARMGAAYTSPKSIEENNTRNKTNIQSFGNDALRPSDYAIWATKNQLLINFTGEFKEWISTKWIAKSYPDVVILTEGWGGIPNCADIGKVKSIVHKFPKTIFIWAPLYVTNHQTERYECFKHASIFNWTETINVRVVDLWDLAGKLGKGRGLVHIGVGGAHMRTAMERIWKEVPDHCGGLL
jgi:hypothetical protein